MAEPLRMFVVQSFQQAQERIYEGRPFQPWENPYRHSLPPADARADAPARQPSRKPKTDPAELARLYEAVRQMLAQGQSPKTIAKALGLTIQRVYNMKYQLKREGS